MNIGKKLRDARCAANMTQESVAEKIGVSRQTVSNWENNRSYPDIVSVIRLSDLYSVSLDILLKEDKEMINYLKENTDAVKSRRQLSKIILVVSYLVVWALLIVLFWCFLDPGDAMGYALLAFYVVLPVITIIISFFIGKDDSWANWRWLMMLFFGIMYMLAQYATFSLANMAAFAKINYPDLSDLPPGIICSAVGLALGSAVRALLKRKALKKNTDE